MNNITAATGKQMVIDTLQSGITPIVFDFQDVVFFENESRMLRTFMVFNSLDLGTLSFKEYRFVARRNSAGYHMVKRHVEKVLRMIPRITEKYPMIECFTIPVFPRLVRDGELISILYDAFALYPEVHPSKLCIEVTADVLFEDMAEIKPRINELRELGVKVAISEVGDEYCPLYKLNEITFDLLLLDAFATDLVTNPDAERAAAGLITYLRTFGVPVIAPELENDQLIETVKLLECDGYSAAHVATSSSQTEEEQAVEDTSDEVAAENAVETSEEVPEEQVTEETPEEPVTEETPEEQVTEEVPEEQVTEELPAEQATAEQVTEEEPVTEEQEIQEDVEITAEEPAQERTEAEMPAEENVEEEELEA